MPLHDPSVIEVLTQDELAKAHLWRLNALKGFRGPNGNIDRFDVDPESPFAKELHRLGLGWHIDHANPNIAGFYDDDGRRAARNDKISVSSKRKPKRKSKRKSKHKPKRKRKSKHKPKRKSKHKPKRKSKHKPKRKSKQ